MVKKGAECVLPPPVKPLWSDGGCDFGARVAAFCPFLVGKGAIWAPGAQPEYTLGDLFDHCHEKLLRWLIGIGPSSHLETVSFETPRWAANASCVMPAALFGIRPSAPGIKGALFNVSRDVSTGALQRVCLSCQGSPSSVLPPDPTRMFLVPPCVSRCRHSVDWAVAC